MPESRPGIAESRTNASDADLLIRHLRPRLNQLSYETAQLVNTNFMIVADSMRVLPGPPAAVNESHTNKFAELFSSGGPVIITPFKPDMLEKRRAGFFDGRGRGGGLYGQSRRAARFGISRRPGLAAVFCPSADGTTRRRIFQQSGNQCVRPVQWIFRASASPTALSKPTPRSGAVAILP